MSAVDSQRQFHPDEEFWGQPKGLYICFFTEMWERFSYYGMRALLILFMTAATTGQNPGLGLDVSTAAAVYGLYTGLVYLLSLPGGWVADNLWGQRKAVYVGGWIIAAGHFSMAVPTTATFYGGLVLIVLGTGLLKPNVSAVVADLYPEGGAARDAGGGHRDGVSLLGHRSGDGVAESWRAAGAGGGLWDGADLGVALGIATKFHE